MPAPPTRRTLQRRANAFIDCRKMTELARLLRVDPVRLAILSEDPEYKTYRIPKKRKGTFRLVEDPEPRLKKVQRKLNQYLQAVYYFLREPSAYGFLTNPTDDPDKRTILTNAQRHIGCNYLMNVDMRDFFHLIDKDRVEEIFRSPKLRFTKGQAKLLAKLCCYNGRLPMGAPTSPILSNLAAIPLDQDLEALAEDKAWTYTRYADDLSFSSQNTPIRLDDLPSINEWINAYDFQLNPNKTIIYGPDYKAKEVTGLIVGETEVELSEDYIEKLEMAIQKLNEVVNTKYVLPSGRLSKTPWVGELEQQVRGRLEFAKSVLPEENTLRIDLEIAFEQALEPPTEYGPVSWMEFGYTLFNLPPV
ncbi:MAG: reverse transcriptase family protein [Bacteroidota bacterium]